MLTLQSWAEIRPHKNGVDILCSPEHRLTVRILEENLFHIRVLKHDKATLKRSFTTDTQSADSFIGRQRDNIATFTCPQFTREITAQTVTLSTDKLLLCIEQLPIRLRWAKKDAAGEWYFFASDRPGGAYLLGNQKTRVAHYMQAADTDRYFGLGDKTGLVDRKGRRYEMHCLDAMGYNAQSSDPLYKHWPFYHVLTAAYDSYGIFYDNLSTCRFDMGNELDNYYGKYRSFSADYGDIDYYFFSGQSSPDTIKIFLRLTGKHPFLPKWSLGYSGSTMHYTDAENAAESLQQFITLTKQHDIPCDSFQLSSGYTSIGNKRYVFHWNKDKIPDPEGLCRTFAAAGMKLCANIKPVLLDDHPKYQEAANKTLFIQNECDGLPEKTVFWDGNGACLDFTRPDTLHWWQENISNQLLAKGIESTWNDNNECEIQNDSALCYGFGEPIPVGIIRPLTALLMSKASYLAQQNFAPEKRPFLISRAGCPGIQRYAQTWSGDNFTSWHTLKWNIRMGVGMSLSGLYLIGHDTGGFAGPRPEPELFIRWIQANLLLPRFTIHSWNDDHSANEPWMYPTLIPAIRENIALRYRLLPYLYHLLWSAACEDEPFIRALFLDHPRDLRCYEDTDQYLIGKNLLIAPVTTPHARTLQVYLPDNAQGWYCFYSGKYYAPGQEISVDAPIERLPIWVRAGCIIPEARLMHADSPEKDNIRILRIFPNTNHSCIEGDIFDDDGLSYRYLHNQYCKIHYRLQTSNRQIRLSVSGSGDYHPAYCNNIHIVLPQQEWRPMFVNGILHQPQQIYSLFSEKPC